MYKTNITYLLKLYPVSCMLLSSVKVVHFPWSERPPTKRVSIECLSWSCNTVSLISRLMSCHQVWSWWSAMVIVVCLCFKIYCFWGVIFLCIFTGKSNLESLLPNSIFNMCTVNSVTLLYSLFQLLKDQTECWNLSSYW